MASKVGPGLYSPTTPNDNRNRYYKNELLQFFGSMTERGQLQLNNETSKHQDIGPGSYIQKKDVQQSRTTRNNTAAFLNYRTKNLFGI